MSDPKEVAVRGVDAVVDALRGTGLEVRLTPEQVEMLGEGIVAVVNLINGAAHKRAAAAGLAAAANVTTVEEANEVLKAASAAQESR